MGCEHSFGSEANLWWPGAQDPRHARSGTVVTRRSVQSCSGSRGTGGGAIVCRHRIAQATQFAEGGCPKKHASALIEALSAVVMAAASETSFPVLVVMLAARPAQAIRRNISTATLGTTDNGEAKRT